MWEFIPPSLHIGAGDNIADHANDHSTHIAHTRYGLREDDLPLLTEDAIWEYRSYNQEWFNFCGVGSRQPQEALRLRRQASLPSPPSRLGSPESDISPIKQTAEVALTNIIEKTVGERLDDLIPRLFRRIERDILEDLLPPMVETALDSLLKRRNVLPVTRETILVPDTSPSHASDADIISISTDDDDAVPDPISDLDSDYQESSDAEDVEEEEEEEEDSINDDFVPRGRPGRGGGGGGRGAGGAGGAGGGGGRAMGRSGRSGTTGDIGGANGRPGDAKGARSSGGGSRHVANDSLSRQSRGDTNFDCSKRTSRRQKDLDPLMASIEEFERELDADSSSLPAPFTSQHSLEAQARECIRRVFKDPNAKEKSPEQLQLLCVAIEAKRDAIFVIRTGGGKSLAWDGPVLVKPGTACVVMVPYASLLDQHLATSLSRGIVAFKYTAGSTPPDNFQVLYIQPETGKTDTFRQ